MYKTGHSVIFKYKYKATTQYRNTNIDTNTTCNTSQPDEAENPKRGEDT